MMSTQLSDEFYNEEEEEAVMILASGLPKKRTGRRIFKETRHPVYRGVRLRNKNKWVCEMRVPNNNKLRIWLGTHATPEMAARAHDVAALALRGKSACLNFADSAWRLTLPVSTDAVEIRRAAMVAAQMFSAADENNNNIDDDDDDEVCISVVEVEDADKALQEQGIYTQLEDLQDLLLSIADEPTTTTMMSPTHSTYPWDDMDNFQPQLSLWDFSN